MSFFDKKYEAAPEPMPLLTNHPVRHPSPYTIPIPIEVCLSLQDRDDLERGVGEGARNNTAFRIAVNAIATEEELIRQGYTTANTAEELHYEFCQKIGLPNSETLNVWKSAQHSTGPSLTEEAIANCANAYIYRETRQVVGGSRRLGLRSRPPTQSTRSKTPPAPTTEQFICELVELRVTGSLLRAKITDYASLTRTNSAEVWRAYQEKLGELDREESREIERQTLEDLLNQRSLDLKQILPPDLAKALDRRASSMNLPSALFLLPLLSAVSSLANPGKRLVVKAGYLVPPPIWSCLVGDSGTMKTPILKSILSALQQLQIEEFERFEAKKKQYEQDLELWRAAKEKDSPQPEPPTMKQILVTDGSWEGLLDALSKQPGGFLYLCDELQSLEETLDRQGRRGDSLYLFNCDPIGKVLKGTSYKDKYTNVPKPLMPFTGGTQTEVYRQYQQSSNSDASGFWGRFLVGYVPDVRSDLFADGGDLNPILSDLYCRLIDLEHSELQITLSPWAKKLYEQIDNEVQDRKVQAFPTFKNVLSKARGYISRIAMALQAIKDASYGARELSREIDGETMAAAIQVMQYHLQQAQYIQSLTGQGDIDPSLMKILELCGENWIAPTQLMKRSRALRSVKSAAIKEKCTQLAEMGLGEVRSSGRSFGFRKITAKLPQNYRKITAQDNSSNRCLLGNSEIVADGDYQNNHPQTFSGDLLTNESLSMGEAKKIDPPGNFGDFEEEQDHQTPLQPEIEPEEPAVIERLFSGNFEEEAVTEPEEKEQLSPPDPNGGETDPNTSILEPIKEELLSVTTRGECERLQLKLRKDGKLDAIAEMLTDDQKHHLKNLPETLKPGDPIFVYRSAKEWAIYTYVGKPSPIALKHWVCAPSDYDRNREPTDEWCVKLPRDRFDEIAAAKAIADLEGLHSLEQLQNLRKHPLFKYEDCPPEKWLLFLSPDARTRLSRLFKEEERTDS